MAEIHRFYGQTYKQARATRDEYKLRCMIRGAVVHRLAPIRWHRVSSTLVAIEEEHAFSDLSGHGNREADAVGILQFLWLDQEDW